MVALPLQHTSNALPRYRASSQKRWLASTRSRCHRLLRVQAGHERVFPGGMEEQRPACGGSGPASSGTVLQVGGQRLAAQGPCQALRPGAVPL